MALDIQQWTKIASALYVPSLQQLHGALTNVANNNRAEFDAYQDFREQTDIIEAELTKRGIAFTPIP
jgi:hypothetical protein